jgi:hypothetical protein
VNRSTQILASPGAEAPVTLIVNANERSRAALLPALKLAFNAQPAFSVYTRPFGGPHPRMRPHGSSSGTEPVFGLVLIDVSSWVEDVSTASLLSQVLPEWIRSDLVGLLKHALVVFVTPRTALQAMAYIVTASKLPHEASVMVLEDDTQMSEWIAHFWSNWQADSPSTYSAESSVDARLRSLLEWLSRKPN